MRLLEAVRLSVNLNGSYPPNGFYHPNGSYPSNGSYPPSGSEPLVNHGDGFDGIKFESPIDQFSYETAGEAIMYGVCLQKQHLDPAHYPKKLEVYRYVCSIHIYIYVSYTYIHIYKFVWICMYVECLQKQYKYWNLSNHPEILDVCKYTCLCTIHVHISDTQAYVYELIYI
jgi:hypothetical protein